MKRPGNAGSADPRSPGSEDPAIALERSIGRVLREQPPYRAPRTLEARVLSHIGRREELHGPHRRFAEWRLAVRIGFIASACLSSMLVLLVWSRLAAHLASTRADPLLTAPVAGLRASIGAFAGLGELATQLYHAIPRDWLYGGLLAAAALYLTLFGLAAAAYRTLRAGTEAAEAPLP